MKVKCIKEYFDKLQGDYIKPGSVFDTTEGRAKVLIDQKVVEEVKEKPKTIKDSAK
ncbi:MULTISPECIES: hypothetical protein [unclassified Breznakia]|uniref:hypothetical protein n=1 Tax=unclassified Breznakia TaxID=2623764 RepID=UPI0024759E57|nr:MULTISPECIES: hypothetical protein [unclassified Breznakia]MDH6367549.1 hypothetical protein [Breznakia sp. PH1-1]MDH6404657.1 hypothetical protein [Breznakia sp. PF1-11]MDH6412379.1 hypothetical protein [Breznakia sp. PFB1-11]MDH6414717.1 hypothetical protein [Breznakia sp. PFB1-14]MDH6417038.1 hypothetical protein [Breznakia sp. PFB1-4]